MAVTTAGTPPGRRQQTLARREAMTGYLFIAPYLIIATIFTFALLAYALYLSFTDLKASYQANPPQFVGIQNYARAFTDRTFILSLQNVFWYFVIVTLFQTVGSLLVAILLNSKLRGMNFYRTMIYSPSVASSVVMALIFNWLFLRTGFINYVLGSNISWLATPNRIFDSLISLFGGDPRNVAPLLRGPSVAWLAIMSMNIFTTIPTFMLMFLAALQDISPSVYEAAEIDGATGVRAFFSITLPLMAPVIALVVSLGTIGTFQVFDQVSLLTAGGPLQTTMVPAFYIYQKTLGTATQPEAGYAAALAFILAIIIVFFTFVQKRFIEPATEM
jgi:multiple sugar transport system permease protein